MDLAISLLVILAGSLGLLLLLLIRFGGKTIEPDIASDLDPILGAKDQVAVYDTYGPYIPMPSHLRTADEMVAWMMNDLPRLTADMQKPLS